MLEQYIKLLEIAIPLGEDLVNAIREHAQDNLSSEEWDALEAGWEDLIKRTSPSL